MKDEYTQKSEKPESIKFRAEEALERRSCPHRPHDLDLPLIREVTTNASFQTRNGAAVRRYQLAAQGPQRTGLKATDVPVLYLDNFGYWVSQKREQ